jgi:hypothetical protein
MTPPPDSGGQINSSAMLPLVDTGRPDTDHISGSPRDRLRESRDALRSSARPDAYAFLFARQNPAAP